MTNTGPGSGAGFRRGLFYGGSVTLDRSKGHNFDDEAVARAYRYDREGARPSPVYGRPRASHERSV